MRCPSGKNVTRILGSEPLLKPNYNSKSRGQQRNFNGGKPCWFFFMSVEGFFKGDNSLLSPSFSQGLPKPHKERT